MPPVHLLVQVVLSRPVEALTPGPYNDYLPQSPQYSTSFANTGITLINLDTLEPTPIDIDPYMVCSPSPPTPEPTEEALRAAAKFDLEQLREETAAHVIHLAQAKLDALLPPLNQDSWTHLQLTSDITDHVLVEDIPLKNIPPPIVEAPITTVASPTLPSPASQPLPIFYPTVDVGPFKYLFAAPPCLPANGHPHQYTVHYEQDCHIWFSSEELVNSQFLNYIPRCYVLGHLAHIFLSFLTDMYLYDHMTLTHMTAYLYNRAISSGTPLFPPFVRSPLFSSYGSL